MAQCTTCLKINKDESLITVRDAAKKEAQSKGYPVAIVEESGDYVFYNAFAAYQNRLIIKEVISHL